VQAILFCRTYRRATTAYDTGKPTAEESELLTQVDEWRNEEGG
jgi:hypothetical protein